MPFYEFLCTKCQLAFEELTKFDPEDNYTDVICPSCGSEEKTRMPSAFSFSFKNPVGTHRYENSHDYRYKTKAPKVQEERALAEKVSHMGTQPYNDIDDINSGEYFGNVK